MNCCKLCKKEITKNRTYCGYLCSSKDKDYSNHKTVIKEQYKKTQYYLNKENIIT